MFEFQYEYEILCLDGNMAEEILGPFAAATRPKRREVYPSRQPAYT